MAAISRRPTLLLCRRCRTNEMGHNFWVRGETISCAYRHKTVSEREQDVTQGLVEINALIYIYAITKPDLMRAGVDTVATESNRTVISTELYPRAQVQDIAKRIHGGWNGGWNSIDAACNRMKEWERRRSYDNRFKALQPIQRWRHDGRR